MLPSIDLDAIIYNEPSSPSTTSQFEPPPDDSRMEIISQPTKRTRREGEPSAEREASDERQASDEGEASDERQASAEREAQDERQASDERGAEEMMEKMGFTKSNGIDVEGSDGISSGVVKNQGLGVGFETESWLKRGKR